MSASGLEFAALDLAEIAGADFAGPLRAILHNDAPRDRLVERIGRQCEHDAGIPGRNTATGGNNERQRSGIEGDLQLDRLTSVTLQPIAARIAVLVAGLNARSSPR